jgi:acetate kinase
VPDESILVINTGSSSLKFGVYNPDHDGVRLVLEGLAEGIGHDGGKLELKDHLGRVLRSESCVIATQGDALDRAIQWLADIPKTYPSAIAHRVVHGGPRLTAHQRITPGVIQELKACVHFAPLHIPVALELIEGAERAYPKVPQFACFDTAFHSTIPEVASRFPIPPALFDEGIRRYGFHGLSYESIVHQLRANLPSRTVIAHLGSGASLAAVKDGQSVDTTMGLTPTGGIPMATRTGDLDPGVLLYLIRVKHMDVDALEQLLNHESGLEAISGGTSDMRKLEAAADSGHRAANLAISIFCTAIRKEIAAYAAVLGGLDALIFTGGIGEHSARVRGSVCSGLDFLGVDIDAPANRSNRYEISSPRSKVRVRVLPSQEDLQIARHCQTLLQQKL